MSDPPDDRCGYTWAPEKQDVPHQSCCYREVWRDYDRCVWHADVPDDVVKPGDELRAQRALSENHEQMWYSTRRPQEILDGAKLSGCHLREVGSFSGCSLRGAEFSDAALQNVNFSRSFLTDAEFSDAALYSSDLSGSDLRYAEFSAADLAAADFSGSDLLGAQFSDADLRQADLSGAELTQAEFADTNLRLADLSDASAKSASFPDAALTGAGLTHLEAVGAQFQDSMLEAVEAEGADFMRCSFTEASLRDGSFQNARFYQADLNGAKLIGADLSDSDLTDVIFTGCDMRGARLDQVRLYGRGLSTVAIDRQTTITITSSSIRNEGIQDSVDQFRQNIETYRQLAELFRDNGLPDREYRYLMRYRRSKGDLARLEGRYLAYMMNRLNGLVTGYGTSPYRTASVGIQTIVFFALMYGLVGLRSVASGRLIRFGGEVPILTVLFESLLFSAITFAPGGTTELRPVTAAGQSLAAVESGIGIVLLVLLTLLINKRITGT